MDGRTHETLDPKPWVLPPPVTVDIGGVVLLRAIYITILYLLSNCYWTGGRRGGGGGEGGGRGGGGEGGGGEGGGGGGKGGEGGGEGAGGGGGAGRGGGGGAVPNLNPTPEKKPGTILGSHGKSPRP